MKTNGEAGSLNQSLSFELKTLQTADIKVYSIKGQIVKRMNTIDGKAGQNELVWDGRDTQGRIVSNGLYFIQVQTQDWSRAQKVLCWRK